MYFYFVTHFGDPVHGVNTIVWCVLHFSLPPAPALLIVVCVGAAE